MELTTNYGWSMPEPTDPVNSSAEYAENMELIDGVVKDIADNVDTKLSKSGDTMSGALNMGGNGIKGIATSSITSGTDAVNKQYVDNVATADCIKKDGSVDFEANQSMGGHKLTGLPASGSFNSTDAVPRWYLTEKAVTYEEGLTADLNANNHKISSLGTPTFNYDAANKKYVDDSDTDKVSKSDTAKQTIQSILMFEEGGGVGWDGDTNGVKIYAPNGSTDGDITCGTIYASKIESAGFENHDAKITGVGTPTNNTDAANKEYVDGFTVNFILSGSTMTTTTTWASVQTAVTSGKSIKAKQTVSGGANIYVSSTYVFAPNASITFVFVTNAQGGSTELRFIRFGADGVVNYYTRSIS